LGAHQPDVANRGSRGTIEDGSNSSSNDYRERPISIPNEVVGLLAAADGLPVGSTSPEVASRQVVEDV
jgi:hypothetical protein